MKPEVQRKVFISDKKKMEYPYFQMFADYRKDYNSNNNNN